MMRGRCDRGHDTVRRWLAEGGGWSTVERCLMAKSDTASPCGNTDRMIRIAAPLIEAALTPPVVGGGITASPHHRITASTRAIVEIIIIIIIMTRLALAVRSGSGSGSGSDHVVTLDGGSMEASKRTWDGPAQCPVLTAHTAHCSGS
ncbi:hypothetical protein AC579_3576 [Pseudocercospora musae]|uniref:Uncharacterized protein n=1 Tax=Pseudocercospora musae TaxID=113226 RepID=A0A139IVV2_9PEZI|nr:hypothetical protein AC579_3576 [Pseudocercospora musae]